MREGGFRDTRALLAFGESASHEPPDEELLGISSLSPTIDGHIRHVLKRKGLWKTQLDDNGLSKQ